MNELLSTKQAAEILQVSSARIKGLCREGRLKGAGKIGRDWLIPREAVITFTRLKRGPKPLKKSWEEIMTEFQSQ